jgi:hypothetical protein
MKMKRSSILAVRLVIILCILGIAYYIVYLFVLRPVLTVDNNISSTTVYNLGGKAVVNNSDAKKFRLAPGTYNVVATTTSGGSVAKLFNLGLLQKVTDSVVNAAAPVTPEIMSTVPGLEATLQNSNLTYVDTTDNTLSQSDAAGNVQIVIPPGVTDLSTDSPASVTQVSSLPNDEKLLITSANYIYVWNGSSLVPLNTDGIDTDNLNQEQILVGSNSLNSDFVVSIGQTVYYYSSVNAQPVQIAQLNTRFNRLVFGGKRFIAFDTTMPYSETTDLAPYYSKQYLVYPVIADLNGHSYQLTQPIVNASVSPDGQHIVIQYRQNFVASIYNVGSSLVPSLTTTLLRSSSPVVWDSSSSFVYENEGTLWRYNTTDLQSTAIAANILSPPSSITLQNDGTLIYTDLTSTGTGIVYEVPTSSTNAQATKTLNQFVLSNLKGTSNYSLSYTNITQPTFVLSLIVNQGTDTIAQASQNATQQIDQALSAVGINPANVSVITGN